MPHVDEGQLHAWLDGAYPAGDRELLLIRTHMQECADCRNLLEQERTIRERAGEILNFANPVADDPPSFEQLSTRQRAVHPRRSRNGGYARLAWAATVVLALGAGWLARGIMPQPEVLDSAVMARESVPSAGNAGIAAEAAYSAAATEPPAAPQPSPAPQVASGGAGADATGSAAARSLPNDRLLAEAAKPGEPVADQPAGFAARVSGSASAEAPPLSAERLADRPLVAVTGMTIERPAPTEWQPSTLAEARQRYGGVLHVPDLPIENVAVARSGPSVLVRITQQLPDRTVLELLHTIPASEALGGNAALAAPAPAAKQALASVSREPTSDAAGAWLLTIERGTTTITARAPIRPDSLANLVRRLQ